MVASYATLINTKTVQQSPRPQYVLVDRHFFQSCLRPLLEKIAFDEAWYLRKYPDIAEAIRKKEVASAHEHYVRHGYFENRLPFEITVDGPWYLNQYPDIREAVRREQFQSAQDHFEQVGFGEGRIPYANFALVA